MKKIISVFLMVTVILVILCSMTACGDKGTETGKVTSGESLAVSFVLGPHSNFPGLVNNAQGIYNKILNVCTNCGSVSYAVVEGDPEQTDSVMIKKSEKHL